MTSISSATAWLCLAVACAACAESETTGTPAAASVVVVPEAGILGEERAALSPIRPANVVTPKGWGAVQFGMTVSAASVALGEAIKVDSVWISDGCTYGAPASFPPSLGFMITEPETIARLDVDTVGVRTPEGIGIGSTEEETLETYAGSTRVEPHPYDGPEWHYVVHLMPEDTMYGYIFETDGKTVQRYRAGRQPELMYIEGCL